MARDATKLLDRIERNAGKHVERPRSLAVVIPQMRFDTMRTRITEMLLASLMIGAGVAFVLPGETTALPHYQTLRTWIQIVPGTEAMFGWAILLLGVLRWAALLVNGFYRRTPLVRIVCCIGGSFLWMTLTITILESDNLPGVPVVLTWTLVFMLAEWYCVLRATVDAHRMDSFGTQDLPKGPRGVRGH